MPKDAQESNWFSAPSALRVYGQYLNLDKDHNGMLSKEELARYIAEVLKSFGFTKELISHYCFRYGTGTLTPVFIDRVFQEFLTYDGEMVRSFS